MNAMITPFLFLCKGLHTIFSAEVLIKFITKYLVEHLNEAGMPRCAQCGSALERFGSYTRTLTELTDQFIASPVSIATLSNLPAHASFGYFVHSIDLDIARVKCTNANCRVTHAILPVSIVPYVHHGLRLIVNVLWLGEMKTDRKRIGVTIEKLCSLFGISTDTYYRWHKRFSDQLATAKAILQSSYMTMFLCLATLMAFLWDSFNPSTYACPSGSSSVDDYDGFAYQFRQRHQMSFMQVSSEHNRWPKRRPEVEVFRHRIPMAPAPFLHFAGVI